MVQRKKLKGLQGKKEEEKKSQEQFWGLVRQDGERNEVWGWFQDPGESGGFPRLGR